MAAEAEPSSGFLWSLCALTYRFELGSAPAKASISEQPKAAGSSPRSTPEGRRRTPAHCCWVPRTRRSGLSIGSLPVLAMIAAPTWSSTRLPTLIVQRVFAIALGYEDLVDHDELRHDPVLAALSGKLEAKRADCAPLAGKSTLNRLEHAPNGAATRYHKIGHDGRAIERLFVDLFLDAHTVPPREIVLDLDAT